MKHLYLIDEGEKTWVAAESEMEALRVLAQGCLGYADEHEYLRDYADTVVTQVPDDEPVKVYQDEPFCDPTPFVVKPAAEWAQAEFPIVASTCV